MEEWIEPKMGKIDHPGSFCLCSFSWITVMLVVTGSQLRGFWEKESDCEEQAKSWFKQLHVINERVGLEVGDNDILLFLENLDNLNRPICVKVLFLF